MKISKPLPYLPPTNSNKILREMFENVKINESFGTLTYDISLGYDVNRPLFRYYPNESKLMTNARTLRMVTDKVNKSRKETFDALRIMFAKYYKVKVRHLNEEYEI